MIKFTDDYLCGIFVIDEQHKELCSFLNLLSNQEIDLKEYKEIFGEIKKYSKYHFVTEEAFWDENSEEEKKHHVECHNKFLNFIERYSNVEKYDHEEVEKLNEFLADWLTTHIKEDDKKMLRFKSHL